MYAISQRVIFNRRWPHSLCCATAAADLGQVLRSLKVAYKTGSRFEDVIGAQTNGTNLKLQRVSSVSCFSMPESSRQINSLHQ